MATFMFYSCSDESLDAKKDSSPMQRIAMEEVEFCGEPQIVDFIAGQHHDAGTITVGNDEEFLYIFIQMNEGWSMDEIHLYLGDALTLGCNPAPGQFPIKVAGPLTSHFFKFPIDEVDWLTVPEPEEGEEPELPCVHIALHADVGTETAWGQGEEFCGGNWSMYFTYCLQECGDTEIEEDPCYQEETAWATGTRYVTKGNWATYTTFVEGAEVVLYAGQTINVGTVKMETVDGMVKLTLSLNEGVTLAVVEGSHAFKVEGYNSTPPAKNPAPGLFTYKTNELELLVDPFTFYGIHLDVQWEIECPETEEEPV